MTDLQKYVWRRLGLRKHFVGKDRVYELVEDAVLQFDCDAVANAKGLKDLDIAAQNMTETITRTFDQQEAEEYGFIWVILLQALAGTIVQILIRWWLESSENRSTMEAIRREMS
jgi:hypothetical protein